MNKGHEWVIQRVPELCALMRVKLTDNSEWSG